MTREDTDESVIVVINDRYPFKKGSVIDLAYGAADAVVSLKVLDSSSNDLSVISALGN